MQPVKRLYIRGMRHVLVCVVAAVAVTGCSASVSTQKQTVTETATVPNDARLDEAFLAQVSLIKGFDGETKRTLIDLGHSVCEAFGNGHKLDVLRILNDHYGVDSAAEFMHASASTYCPDQLTNH